MASDATVQDTTVFVVDDDPAVLESMSLMLASQGFQVHCFESAERFLAAVSSEMPGCLILDYRMPGMSGIELLRQLVAVQPVRPTIMLSGHADIPAAVGALRLGAINFLEKPFNPQELITAIHDAHGLENAARTRHESRKQLDDLLSQLTQQERAFLVGLLQGLTNREIAEQLDVSLRTIQFRRSSVFTKLQVETKAELIELLTAAGWRPEMNAQLVNSPATATPPTKTDLSL